MLPVHVEVWMLGKRFEQQLEPFQRLVFQFHSVFSDQISNKASMEKALHTFRHKHYNQFLFEHGDCTNARKFIQRLKDFEELKKPSKKDFTSLYDDLCAFRQGEWIGGHCDGVPVLSQWKADLTECPHIYQKWYKDEVREIQNTFGYEPNKCAVTGVKWTWKTTDVPASVQMISDQSEPTEHYKSCLVLLKKYLIVPRPEITHVSQTFLDMFTEMAVRPNTPVEEQLHDLYMKRIPSEYDGVMKKQSLQTRVTQLETDLKDAEERASNNNALYKECSLSLDRISKRLSQLEHSLGQYQIALRERDDIIERMRYGINSVYNNNWN